MRSSRVLIATALFFVVIGPSFGSCTFPVNISNALPGFGGYRLSWQPVISATNYQVEASSDGFRHSTTLANLGPGTSGVTVNELTSYVRGSYSFRITATSPSNPFASDVPCTGTAMNLNFSGIAISLARRVNRIVIPVAGSTRGANNAQFKTSLRLGPPTSESIGKIIFHPAGRAGSDDDPSIPFRVERGETLQFDDIVAAIGQSGIGSLDITFIGDFGLPEVGLLPVEARLFNEGVGGTYGAFEAPVMPPDAYQPLDWNIFVPSARFRVNLGIRTLTTAHVTFYHFAAGGPVTEKVLDLPADYVFLDAADHFFGVAVNPGDSIQISVSGDNVIAIPFHTFTDNSTNDPAVFNPQSPAHVTFPILDIPTATP
ncbi:MAG TPA: hypothetical protein VNN25_03475 [Thermoanaerobaculia bacterium]|nr:hypothetical protein [Thermoanaerobaculia bacterium]